MVRKPRISVRFVNKKSCSPGACTKRKIVFSVALDDVREVEDSLLEECECLDEGYFVSLHR
eukprot:m.177150 g.177150  ORF g.177150 m.177150 type:complete len:61 (+) comp39155_c0_seq1:27-209(+)